MTYESPDGEQSLWNEDFGMYFDAIQWGNGVQQQIPVRSLVGLIPLYATLTLEPSVINRLPSFKKRMDWFINNRPELASRNMANMKGTVIVFYFPFPTGIVWLNAVPWIQLTAAENADCLLSLVRSASYASLRKCWTRPNSSPITGSARE